jgi:hypothetical protein
MPADEPLDYATLTKQALQEVDAALEAAAPPPEPTAEQKAQNLRVRAVAAYLYGALAPLVGNAFDVATFQLYLEGFLAEAGAPTDPVERLLLEQLVLAHHVIGRLHVHAGSRQAIDEVKAYHAAAVRLMAEVRRTALALQSYRQAAAKQPSSEPQPRPAVNGAVAKGNGAALAVGNRAAHTELGSKRLNGYLHDHEPAHP